MILNKGDAFAVWENSKFLLAVPTAAGWTPSGRGLLKSPFAHRVLTKCPTLDIEYGRWCQEHGHTPMRSKRYRVICVPTKPLNPADPHHTYLQYADPRLVEHAYKYLSKLDQTIISPLLGTIDGKMPLKDAFDIASRQAKNNIILVVGGSLWPILTSLQSKGG